MGRGLRFAYQRVEADPSPADPADHYFRPVVPIRIIGRTGDFRLESAVLDTGAGTCILPEEIKDIVGPDLRDPVETEVLRGADGKPFVVMYGAVDLELRMERQVLRWRAKVGFNPRHNATDDEEGLALLGDAGFLRYFTATFNGPGRYCTLRPNGEFPDPIMPKPRKPRRRLPRR